MNMQLILILLLIVAALCLIPTCSFEEKVQPIQLNTQSKADSLESTHSEYQKQFQEYKKENAKLKFEISVVEMQLGKEKEKVKKLQRQVKDLIKSDWEEITQEEKLEKCDSLRRVVEKYETVRETSDSLIEMKIKTLEQSIELKDEQIRNTQKAYQEVKTILESSLSDNEVCVKHVEKMDKKLKRRQKVNQILGGSTAVVILFATTLLLVAGK